MKLYIGIDPGAQGAAVFLDGQGNRVDVVRFGKCTEHDVARAIDEWSPDTIYDTFAVLEAVHSMPRQGVATTFQFGSAFGFIRGVLVALKIPYELVTPATWQRAMGCLSKGDKRVTKAAAQRLFPNEKITNDVADAYLIAEYARRKYGVETTK